MRKTIVIGILTAVLCLASGCSEETAGGAGSANPTISSSSSSAIDVSMDPAPVQTIASNDKPEGQLLSKVEADLAGSGRKQTVSLYLKSDENGNPLQWSVLVDGQTVVRPIEQDQNNPIGPSAVLKAEDLTGDGNPEILVYRYSTGSGGAAGLRIYQPRQKWATIFNMAAPFADSSQSGEKSGRYETSYEAASSSIRFSDRSTGLEANIPLDMTQYKAMDQKLLHKWLSGMTPWVDPVSEFIFLKSDQGSSEIITVQRIIGISHPDTIGYLRYHYRLMDNRYVPYETELQSAGGKMLALKALDERPAVFRHQGLEFVNPGDSRTIASGERILADPSSQTIRLQAPDGTIRTLIAAERFDKLMEKIKASELSEKEYKPIPYLAVSPMPVSDGHSIVFVSNEHALLSGTGGFQLKLIHDDGTGERVLPLPANIQYPMLKDTSGNRIFIEAAPDRSLLVYDIATKKTERFQIHGTVDAISRDGEHVLFRKVIDSLVQHKLYILDCQTGHIEAIGDQPSDYFFAHH